MHSTNHITVVTNPVREMVLIKSDHNFSAQDFYTISDTDGNEIIVGKGQPKHGNLLAISVDFLKRGVYLLMIKNESQYSVKSFVKI